MNNILIIPSNKKDSLKEWGFNNTSVIDKAKEILGSLNPDIYLTRIKTSYKDRKICLITSQGGKRYARASRIRKGFPFAGIRGDAIVCAIDWSGYAQSHILTGLTNEEICMIRVILKK